MWTYEKRLQFPVKIRHTCPKTAQMIISQYGGAGRRASGIYALPCTALYDAFKGGRRPPF